METKQLPQNPSEITVSETVAASKSPSVPSPNSSPSHEFSFTISLHSAQITAPSSPTLLSSKNKQQQQQQQQLEAIDLSPADDIFFHGHLLPLHFLSHVHASPRTSTATSLDNYYPQTRDEKFVNQYNINNNNNNNFTEDNHEFIEVNDNNNTCDIPKPKSFSLSGFTKDKSERIKKLKFDVGQLLKRYIKMVKPLLSPKERRTQKQQQQQQQQQQEERDNEQRKCQSFSGSLTPKIHRRELRDLRGEFSAPVSMRTSPTNSGLLVAKAGVSSPALATSGSSVSSVVSVSESTMDELHAAIQSAIAHCKNSASSQFNSSSSSSSSPPLRVS